MRLAPEAGRPREQLGRVRQRRNAAGVRAGQQRADRLRVVREHERGTRARAEHEHYRVHGRAVVLSTSKTAFTAGGSLAVLIL